MANTAPGDIAKTVQTEAGRPTLANILSFWACPAFQWGTRKVQARPLDQPRCNQPRGTNVPEDANHKKWGCYPLHLLRKHWFEETSPCMAMCRRPNKHQLSSDKINEPFTTTIRPKSNWSTFVVHLYLRTCYNNPAHESNEGWRLLLMIPSWSWTVCWAAHEAAQARCGRPATADFLQRDNGWCCNKWCVNWPYSSSY